MMNLLVNGKINNTEKSDKKVQKAFIKILQQNTAMDLEYWLYQQPELDYYLVKVWLGVCKNVWPKLNCLGNCHKIMSRLHNSEK